ncbi:MAG: hypothetical protein ACI8UG_002668, partial [Gammaproteobacteria bacterium]
APFAAIATTFLLTESFLPLPAKARIFIILVVSLVSKYW